MDDFGNSIDHFAFMTKEVIFKRCYFFNGDQRHLPPHYPEDNAT